MAWSRQMSLKVTLGHHKWQYSIGHISIPFAVHVTACVLKNSCFVRSNAVSCSSCDDAVIDLLLHTLQQKTKCFSLGQTTPKNCLFPLGSSEAHLVHGSLGPPESTL